MFDKFLKFFKKSSDKEENKESKDTAKERLHLVLMQDRANVSADFMELMKQEIIEVIKKYIDVDENSIDVKLTNTVNSDGSSGVPMLYANIPIINVKEETNQIKIDRKVEEKTEENKNIEKEENKEIKEENNIKEDIKQEEKIETEVEEKSEENEDKNKAEV